MEIDNESLFKKYLKKGINLFTGAGFSVLPDKNGEKLPDASGLSEELKNRYPDLLEGMENDLPILSSLIPEQELRLNHFFCGITPARRINDGSCR